MFLINLFRQGGVCSAEGYYVLYLPYHLGHLVNYRPVLMRSKRKAPGRS